MAAPKNPLDRYRVPILDRTLDLLELLSRQTQGLTLTEMTERLRQPKNSVFRIATTLALRGYVDRDEADKTYRAGRKLLRLGHAALGGERLVQSAWPVLAALRDATGETALLGTLAGSRGIVLDQAPSLHPVKVVVEVGHAFPLHTAAPAKAMLAFVDDGQRERLIAQMRFERHTRHTLRTAAAYRRELASARRCGYALDRGEESESFLCAAAPVFDHRHAPVAALWVSGPTDRIGRARLPALAEEVRRHALQLSRLLGFEPADSAPDGAR